MPNQTFYLETHSQDCYYNLAFEEYVLRNRTSGDYLLLWQNDNTIVIGQNQNAEAEINRGFVEAHGIHVVRRSTGGGAVYHDLGNLNYSFITDVGNAETLTIERFTRPVVEALKSMGANASASGRNDILVDGKKVSGTAQRMVKDRILHHGTLLFDSDPSMVAGALNVDPEKFKSKSAKSVRSRIGNIRPALPADCDLPAFWARLREALAGEGLVQTDLSDEEKAAVQKLRDEKYATWEWNFGRSPAYSMTNRRRFEAGSVEVRLDAEHDRIRDIVFYGDFLAIDDLTPLTEALKGTPLRRDDIAAVLDRFDLKPLFGGITRDELLSVIFTAGDL